MVIDPLSLAACVPGVQEVNRVDDRTFTGRITASVGPIDGQFTFESVITRAEQPELEVEMQGQDSVTKSRLTTSMQVALERVSEHGDLFEPVLHTRQTLGAALKALR